MWHAVVSTRRSNMSDSYNSYENNGGGEPKADNIDKFFTIIFVIGAALFIFGTLRGISANWTSIGGVLGDALGLIGMLVWPAWYFQVLGGALMVIAGAGGLYFHNR